MLKKLLIFSLVFVSVSPISYAKVIELDHKNADHCRQQILSSTDPYPIIFIYMNKCPYADKLRPIYEEVSNEMPQRTFFAFNFKEHDYPAMNYVKQGHDCLGKVPFISPVVSVYMLRKNDAGPMIVGELKSGLDGGSSKADIVKLISMNEGLKLASS